MAEPGTTNGADPQGTAAPATNPAPGGDPAASPPGDYLARIRAEPDFAVEQIREKDRKVTEISQRQKALEKKLGPTLSGVIDQLGGGDGVYHQLVRLDRFMGNPALRRALEHYERTGTLPAGGQEGFETSEPEDPQMAEIAKLRQQVQRLEAQTVQTRGAVGKQSIVSALGKLQEEFPDSFDDVIKPYIHDQVEKWEQTSAGQEILSTLGYDQLRNLAGVAIVNSGKLEEIGERIHLRKLENLKRSATGAPGGTTTTGRELPARAKYTHAREALAEFERQGLGRGS